MSSFSAAPGSATFTVTEGGFSDKGGLVSEWSAIVVVDQANWPNLVALQTPKDMISVRPCRAAPGTLPTVSIDIGGGAGPGTLTIDNYDTRQALLQDLAGEAPIGDTPGTRVVKATWLLIS